MTSRSERMAGVLQLAAVERHLREDEESSVDSCSGSSRFSDALTPKSSRSLGRNNVSPPRLKPRRRSGQREIPEHFSAQSALLSANEDSPLDGSRRGMSVTIERVNEQSHRRSDESLSLSSGSSFDSADELEKRSLEIRNDLRIAELFEIARVAERAAESGLDSFTASASTYNNDEHPTELKPLMMKRTKTYSEGLTYNQHWRRPMLRNNSDTLLTQGGRLIRKKRKIPVLSLRHIDDLIPPLEHLHLHLRSHFYRVGVETEKSLVNEPVNLDLVDADFEKSGGETRSINQKRGIIRIMKSWMTVEHNDVKKIMDAGEASSFDVGDRLSEQIASESIMSGGWKPGPVEMPEGLIPFEEHDVTHDPDTPSRKQRPPRSYPKDQGDQATIETSQLTEPNSLSSEFRGESQFNPRLTPCPHTPLQLQPSPNIKPVALFDAKDDEEEVTEHSASSILGSRSRPKPFSVEKFSYEPSTPTATRSIVDTHGQIQEVPNLYVTPVRLKGIRDKRNVTRSSVAWGFPRSDSFRSESGTSPTFTGRKGSTECERCEEKLEKSEPTLLSDCHGSKQDGPDSWLVPRSGSLTEMINSLNTSEWTQSAGQSTHDQRETNPKMNDASLLHDSDTDCSRFSQSLREIVVPSLTDAATLAWIKEGHSSLRNKFISGFESPKLSATSPGEENPGETSRVSETPSPNQCECLGCITKAPSSDFWPNDNEEQPNLAKDLDISTCSEASNRIHRRVMSCPTFAENWDDMDFIAVSPTSPLTGPNKSKMSLMRAFHRLTPSPSKIDGGRTLHFHADENNEYLNNYLYFGKQVEGRENIPINQQPDAFCFSRPCGGMDEGSCEFLAVVTNFLLQQPTEADQDFLSFKTNDYATTFTGETWFDSASEKFDNALERLVGSTRQSHKDWGNYFHAPTLNIKTPPTARRIRASSISGVDPQELASIVLIRQNPRKLLAHPNSPAASAEAPTPTKADAISDDEFIFLYGVSREEYRALTKEQRLALWHLRDKEQSPDKITPIGVAQVKPPSHLAQARKRKTRKQHRTAMSTSDIGQLLGTDDGKLLPADVSLVKNV